MTPARTSVRPRQRVRALASAQPPRPHGTCPGERTRLRLLDLRRLRLAVASQRVPMRALALMLLGLAALGCAASHEPVPEDAPLPGDLLEIDLTEAQRAALCAWWMGRHGGEGTLTNCPPPPAEPGFTAGLVGCDTLRRADVPDCRATVQDWYACELSEPYWWCRQPLLAEVCRRPASCGPPFFRP